MTDVVSSPGARSGGAPIGARSESERDIVPALSRTRPAGHPGHPGCVAALFVVGVPRRRLLGRDGGHAVYLALG